MSDQLRWGIVGCGDVVERKSGPSIVAAAGSRIVAAMRRDIEKARPFVEANDIPVCTADPAEVIEHSEVDIVYVATPPSSHMEYVLAAAGAGKHVLVEKPMGMSAAQDREMIDACERAGVELFVAYYRRFHPHVLKMKALIDSGAIGRPATALIDFAQAPGAWDPGWRIQPKISGGGLFVDVVSHRLDVMTWLLDDVDSVAGLKIKVDPDSLVEQAAALAVIYGGGTVCSVLGDFASARTADRFMISGTEGTISSERLDGHTFELIRRDKTEHFQFEPYPAPHLGLIRHVQDVVAGVTPNLCSGADGLQTDLVLDQGLRLSPIH